VVEPMHDVPRKSVCINLVIREVVRNQRERQLGLRSEHQLAIHGRKPQIWRQRRCSKRRRSLVNQSGIRRVGFHVELRKRIEAIGIAIGAGNWPYSASKLTCDFQLLACWNSWGRLTKWEIKYVKDKASLLAAGSSKGRGRSRAPFVARGCPRRAYRFN
jgi:hypothetical protein